MKKVLIVHYSQTGQLSSLAQNFTAPLQTAGIQVDCVNIVPEQAFPFPWPFWRFFDTFPETVHLKPAPILPPHIPSENYDVVVIAYTVWFLSPSQPMTAFLQREETRRLLDGKPVITLIGCRNMWLGAQEKMKSLLKQNGAKLIGNIVKIDACNSLPSAGIAEEELVDAARFGTKLRDTLLNQQPLDETLFQNMGAVTVNEKLIFSERAAGRSFFVWGKLLMAAGRISPLLRRALLCFYIVFLLTMILVVLPISVILKKLLHPLLKGRLKKLADYYEQPSGR